MTFAFTYRDQTSPIHISQSNISPILKAIFSPEFKIANNHDRLIAFRKAVRKRIEEICYKTIEHFDDVLYKPQLDRIEREIHVVNGVVIVPSKLYVMNDQAYRFIFIPTDQWK